MGNTEQLISDYTWCSALTFTAPLIAEWAGIAASAEFSGAPKLGSPNPSGAVARALEYYPKSGLIGASRLAADAASRTSQATIAQLVARQGEQIADDALVNFGSTARGIIEPSTGVRSYRLRFGDIKHLTPKQVQTVIGDLASAGRPGGANVIRVAEETAGMVQRPASNAAGIVEHVCDKPVTVIKNVGIAGK